MIEEEKIEEARRAQVMMEIGVEGDRFRPHPWTADCVKAGCVPADLPPVREPITLPGAISLALHALNDAERGAISYGGYAFGELYRTAGRMLWPFSLGNQAKEYVTIDMVIAVLNEALAADPDAINALVNQRTHCNQALLDHPTIQVAGRKVGDLVVNAELGFLGLLNGVFGARSDGWGFIVAQFDTPGGKVIKFTRASADPENPAYVRCG